MTAFKTAGNFTLLGFFHEGGGPVARLAVSDTIPHFADFTSEYVSFTCDGLGLLIPGIQDDEEVAYLQKIYYALDSIGAAFEAYQDMLNGLSEGSSSVSDALRKYDLGVVYDRALDFLRPLYSG